MYYSCVLHFCVTLVCYTCVIHVCIPMLCVTFVCYTCVLHLYVTRLCYTCVLHLCVTLVCYTCLLLLCVTLLCWAGALGKWLAPLPLTRVRDAFPGLGGLKEIKMFLPYPLVKLCIVENLRDREVACSVSDLKWSNFESCV